MMRVRRASLIAVLLVIAWAATGSAECAWVAWLSSVHRTGLTNITPIGASDSKAACEQRIESMKETRKAKKKEQNTLPFYTPSPPAAEAPGGAKEGGPRCPAG